MNKIKFVILVVRVTFYIQRLNQYIESLVKHVKLTYSQTNYCSLGKFHCNKSLNIGWYMKNKHTNIITQ